MAYRHRQHTPKHPAKGKEDDRNHNQTAAERKRLSPGTQAFKPAAAECIPRMGQRAARVVVHLNRDHAVYAVPSAVRTTHKTMRNAAPDRTGTPAIVCAPVSAPVAIQEHEIPTCVAPNVTKTPVIASKSKAIGGNRQMESGTAILTESEHGAERGKLDKQRRRQKRCRAAKPPDNAQNHLMHHAGAQQYAKRAADHQQVRCQTCHAGSLPAIVQTIEQKACHAVLPALGYSEKGNRIAAYPVHFFHPSHSETSRGLLPSWFAARRPQHR